MIDTFQTDDEALLADLLHHAPAPPHAVLEAPPTRTIRPLPPRDIDDIPDWILEGG